MWSALTPRVKFRRWTTLRRAWSSTPIKWISCISLSLLWFPLCIVYCHWTENREALWGFIDTCTVCLLACSRLLLIELTIGDRTINICFYKYTLCPCVITVVWKLSVMLRTKMLFSPHAWVPLSGLRARSLSSLSFLDPDWVNRFQQNQTILKLLAGNEPLNYLQWPF